MTAKENANAGATSTETGDTEAAKAAAVAKREAYEQQRAKAERTGKELVYIDEYLEAHGLTISDLLRTVAKNFHGISIPLYVEPVEKED